MPAEKVYAYLDSLFDLGEERGFLYADEIADALQMLSCDPVGQTSRLSAGKETHFRR